MVIAGQFAFWAGSWSVVYRAQLPQVASPEALLLDQRLSPAPEDARFDSSQRGLLLAGSATHVYAALGDRADDLAGLVATRIVRWPVEGGPGEVLVESDARVSSLFVFGSDLAWVATHEDDPYLFSCDVESCEATTRALGLFLFQSDAVAADESYLYWTAAQYYTSPQQLGAVFLRAHEIRRVPLLATVP